MSFCSNYADKYRLGKQNKYDAQNTGAYVHQINHPHICLDQTLQIVVSRNKENDSAAKLWSHSTIRFEPKNPSLLVNYSFVWTKMVSWMFSASKRFFLTAACPEKPVIIRKQIKLTVTCCKRHDIDELVHSSLNRCRMAEALTSWAIVQAFVNINVAIKAKILLAFWTRDARSWHVSCKDISKSGS